MLPFVRPDTASLATKGKQLFTAGRFDEARDAFETVIKIAPQHAESHIFLSRIAYETGDRAACISALETASALLPTSIKAWLALAERYGQFGDADKALGAFDKAIALGRDQIKPQADKAHYLQSLGRFDDAEALFRKLLRKHPDQAELYRVFLGSKTLKKGDPLLRQMGKLWANPRLPDEARMNLGFALAKAMEETGEPSKVFGFLDRANGLQAKLAPYDRAQREAEWRGMLAAQDGADLTPVGPAPALRPVIVCGMPRSGTTLVERIIARHSQASAGGEMGHALKGAMRLLGKGDTLGPLKDQPDERLAEWSALYTRLAQRDTGATEGVVTDKSIQNHMIFGLIHRALPGARIIVVQRDPRDIALSIYKNHFRLGTHRYANSLADIADEILRFRKSVRHWQERLPGAIHEIRYEDLVGDPEPQARRLIEMAGLDWEDGCLDVRTKAAAAVQTLSLAQVRAPIHAGRRDAWRQFETALHPFIDAWGDEPWD